MSLQLRPATRPYCGSEIVEDIVFKLFWALVKVVFNVPVKSVLKVFTLVVAVLALVTIGAYAAFLIE
jgi:hypothetical protein